MDEEQVSRLIKQVSLADRAAFSQLYDLTSAKLFAVIVRIVRDGEEAEDALQDCYANLWRRAKTFDQSRARAAGWLVMIARNAAIDRLRRRRPTQPLDPVHDPVDESPTPEARTSQTQDARRLHACLEQLTEAESGLVRRAFFGGDSYSEVAEATGRPLGTVKSVIRRALSKLRRCLDS
jgi:RNA polymerase sigma-70 factor (ECF subfamily)